MQPACVLIRSLANDDRSEQEEEEEEEEEEEAEEAEWSPPAGVLASGAPSSRGFARVS